MNSFDLVIFDLDGTVADTLTDVHLSLNLALEQLNLPQISVETSKKAIGPGPQEFIKHVLPSDSMHRSDEFHRVFRPIYLSHCIRHAQLFEGIRQLVDQLKNENILCALATNKARLGTQPLADKFSFDSLFNLVVTRDEVEKPKPSPDMLIKAADLLSIPTSRALMIGDTDNDLYAAQSAGMKFCLARWGYSDKMDELAASSDFVAAHPLEIMNFIKMDVYADV
ncbi:MAG: HAD family hydrolase [Calditrichaeota bacterium]|nr:MAG: HAD family hydrolase [Calditrichota bacterium]